MPFRVKFEKLPQGICLTPARDGDTVTVLMTEYLSTEDGHQLIERLEGFVDDTLRLIPVLRRPRPSQIDHMLVVVSPDRSATIYVNELSLGGRVRASRSIKKGEAFGVDDVADIVELDVGVEIPIDAGVMFLLSQGWRRGLFYDWQPLAQGRGEPRTDDLRVVFGQMQAHLAFQELHSLTDADWTGFFSGQWFPFKSLRRTTLLKMRDYIRSGWSVDELLPEITDQVKESVRDWVNTWSRNETFANHLAILEKAVEHFLRAEYLSATLLIYPRIEGSLRSSMTACSEHTAVQRTMSEHAAQPLAHLPQSLLLPRHFARYLDEVYFANFDPNDQAAKVSRNTIGHGIASATECNEKAAVIGILLARHLSLCLSTGTVATTENDPSSDAPIEAPASKQSGNGSTP